MVNNLKPVTTMEKLHIAEDNDNNGNEISRTRNIFYELAAKVEKDLEN